MCKAFYICLKSISKILFKIVQISLGFKINDMLKVLLSGPRVDIWQV